MDRGHFIIIGVVVVALGLFGLKVWTDQTGGGNLDSGGRGASQRLARAAGMSDPSDLDGGPGSDSETGRPARLGGGVRGPGGATSGGGASMGSRGAGMGPDGRSGGSAEVLRGAGVKSGGGGSSGSGRAAGGAGGGVDVAGGGGEGGAHLGPKAQQKDNLVQFLSSQPATQPQLASAKTEQGDGQDVALKIDKPEDISQQGGQDQNVQEAQSGDGVKVGETGDIKFPNNINPDAATISMTIQPEWSGSDPTDNALLELRGEHDWANRVELVKNGDYLRFILTPNTGQESDISVRITDWQAGDAHDVQASYGDGKTSLYIDGRLVGSNQYAGQLDFPDNIPLHVGGDYPGSNYAGANSTLQIKITNNANHGQ